MANELKLNFEEFNTLRVSKAGKTIKLDFLRMVLNGTPKERAEFGRKLALGLWGVNNYKELINSYEGVFKGKAWDAALTTLGFNTANPSKVACLELFAALARLNPNPKGIKATYLECATAISKYEAVKAVELATGQNPAVLPG